MNLRIPHLQSRSRWPLMLYALLRTCSVFALCLSLIITPQMVLAANLLVYSNLSALEMDLGNAILRVDRIDSNLSISLNTAGELTVSRFHAKRASLTFKPSPKAANPSTSNTLPANIALPLPIQLQQGLIDELTIVQADESQTLKQIQFNLHANDQTLALELQVSESPWGQLHTAVDMVNKKPFALNGWLSAQNTQASTPYQLKANISGDLAQIHVTAHHLYQPENSGFAIVPADLNLHHDNLIKLTADISLQDQMPAHLEVALQALNAAHIHPQLNGQLNLSLTADGMLSGQQPLKVLLQAHDSQLQQHPLILNAEATLVDFVLSSLNLDAQLASNTLHVEGGLNANDPSHNTLRWQANWPSLSQVMTGLSGKISSQGELTHSGDDYQTHYQLQAEKLRLPDAIQIGSMQAQGQFSTAAQAPLDNKITITGLHKGASADATTHAINAQITLNGSLAKHTLTLSTENTDTQQATFGLDSVIEGGISAQGWQGTLSKLTSRDQTSIRLAQPAPMRYSAETGFAMQQMQLKVQEGTIQLDALHYLSAQTATANSPALKARFNTQGRIEQLPVKALQDYLGLTNPNVEQSLTLNGAWNVDIAEQINAEMTLTRADGDITLHDVIQKTKQNLGLSTIHLQSKIVNNQLNASATIESQHAGNIQASAATTFTSTAHGFALNRNAPLALHVEANLQHLNWLALHDASTTLDGQLNLKLDGHGTLAAPELDGYLRGEHLAVQIPSQGVLLNNGTLSASFAKETLTITQLDFEGKSGTLHAQGQANLFKNPAQLNLQVEANRFTALSRTDRFIVLSGEGDMQLASGRALISGQFKVHNGLFELPKAGKPILDDDIIILGKQTEENPTNIALVLDALNIDFGRKPTAPYDEAHHFLLRGQGLNGALSGQVKLSGNLQQLQAFGALEVNGTYLAYGQLLDIETGQINFSGPISNAGLNIVAMRNLEPTKVGVKLTGDIQSPELKLVSDPETSSDDKLSLLVLGRPMSEAGSSELALLSVAAGALLSQGDSVPLQSKIAGIVGFDSLDVKGTNATNYSVNIGKRINRKLVIGYEKSLFGLLNVAKLTYQLTRRVAIETKAGSENALDVVYSFDFD
ncbi:hypothetical protein Meth11DRAFT_1860 [Methylophilaceae bacterium 11]|nr:hypothetical protein Meth11DRAFT_1860 [Methylophilaceae bacterium 11]